MLLGSLGPLALSQHNVIAISFIADQKLQSLMPLFKNHVTREPLIGYPSMLKYKPILQTRNNEFLNIVQKKESNRFPC